MQIHISEEAIAFYFVVFLKIILKQPIINLKEANLMTCKNRIMICSQGLNCIRLLFIAFDKIVIHYQDRAMSSSWSYNITQKLTLGELSPIEIEIRPLKTCCYIIRKRKGNFIVNQNFFPFTELVIGGIVSYYEFAETC